MKNNLNTEECNKLIANFMKLKKSDNAKSITYKKGSSLLTVDKLKYHKSWSLLMEVVEKIENPVFACRNRTNTSFSITIIENKCAICIKEFSDEIFTSKVISSDTYEPLYLDNNLVMIDSRKISHCYATIVKFIKWYNKHYK
jgi:hypothetical protein